MAAVKLALLCLAATRAFLRPAPRLARRPAPLRAAADVASRVVAFRVLEAARAREAPVDELLRRHGASLGERDLAFAKRLVDTAQRRAGDIDAEIDAACRRRPKGATLAALRLGVAQLLFCDGVPSRAAVHSSVEVCKAFRGSPGLVNGVLRGIDRRRGAAPAAAGAAAAAPWLREALERDHGAEVAARYLAAAAKAPERLDVTCATAGDRVEIRRRFGGSPPNFGTLELGHIDVDSADFWTKRSLSSCSRSTVEERGALRSMTRTLKSG